MRTGAMSAVKCDRQDPCLNCTEAHAVCSRTRQARIHRPRVSRYLTGISLDALAERLAKLENSTEENFVFSSASPATAISEPRNLPPSPQVKSTDFDRVFKKRKQQPFGTRSASESSRNNSDGKRKIPQISQSIESVTHREYPSLGETHDASEAREYIEHELQWNPALSHDRRTALEVALKFVSQLSNPGLYQQQNSTVEQYVEVEDRLEHPILTPELLYTMLPGPDKKTNSQGIILWPDHISNKCLERMGLAIIEASENEQLLHLYRIIVAMKAIQCISKLLPLVSSERLKIHFRTLKKQYEMAALEDLNSIPLMTPPSLVLLQALLSGKALFQILGDMERCWMVTASACRVLVALNYHNIISTVPQNDVEDDIHACIYTCYHYDKTLSLLLLRPPCLPELRVNPTQLVHLDPELPTTEVMIEIVQLAELKSIFVNTILDTKNMGAMEKAGILSDIVLRAKSIYSNAQIYRSRQEHDFPELWTRLRRNWLSIDFNYYSALTTFIQARSSALKSRLVCEDCLFAARKTLTTLQDLLGAVDDTDSVDSYPYFLTWTMLLFPLTPFYVLFCNVVATSNLRDFEMIKKITDDLRQFTKANASIGKLYRLFSKFLDLSAPLIKTNPGGSFEQPSDATDRQGHSEFLGPGADAILISPPSPAPNQMPQSVEGWNDSLMWELFDNQPSLGWTESELWDAMTQL
ncbi:transcriptional regulator family: Fungal Specific TF [Penicillium taxi]|uniref:transcriptional regulator family: Fungal Specific TF n=1 Tax=Penicillium taxi TaxID=168475 RepID=UPI0025457C09|nr:transcriptional regulator family: Fungal Specific TF [Penicillium taxi]KAJ5885120.1 transcriptional regulator family: Fungal Specific TF [Penicillium taxi]